MAKNDLPENSGIRNEYTLWRQKKNVYFSRNKTFSSGARAADKVDEYVSYAHTSSFIGSVVLACAVLKVLINDLVPLILDALPLNISYDVWNGVFWGDKSVIFVLNILYAVLTFAFIIFAVFYFEKLPERLIFTKKVRSKAFLKAAFPAAFALGVIYIITAQIFGSDILPLSPDIPTSVQFFFGIIVIPVLCEITYRGALLFLLRQYGDLSALLTVSVIISLLEFDVRLIPATFIASAVLCYFSLASENVAVPIIMHIIMSAVISAYALMRQYSVPDSTVYAFFAVCLAAGIIAVFYIISRHFRDIETENTRDSLPSREKFFCMITSVPVIAAITAMLIFGYL
ncbi:MAG: CPBP family intramembrane metalloprotease [Ruminococcus sp.]|jgi:membrane protease YdiL (CAAX protease family)|nr:CPBP family intramembrane metalloprotease [Ruminococcus sp.]